MQYICNNYSDAWKYKPQFHNFPQIQMVPNFAVTFFNCQKYDYFKKSDKDKFQWQRIVFFSQMRPEMVNLPPAFWFTQPQLHRKANIRSMPLLIMFNNYDL